MASKKHKSLKPAIASAIFSRFQAQSLILWRNDGLDLFCSGNGNNDGKYSNPDFDAAIDASRVADSAEHFAQLHKAEDILMEDMGCLPIAYYNDYWLQSSSLKGTWHSPYGYWYLQYGYIEE